MSFEFVMIMVNVVMLMMAGVANVWASGRMRHNSGAEGMRFSMEVFGMLWLVMGLGGLLGFGNDFFLRATRGLQFAVSWGLYAVAETVAFIGLAWKAGYFMQSVPPLEQVRRFLARSGLAPRDEAKLRVMSAIMADPKAALIVVDDAGFVTDWGSRAAELFGRTKAEMVGRDLTAIMPERYRGRHLAALERLRANPEDTHILGRRMALEGLHRDGSEFPVELMVTAWDARDGQRRYLGLIHKRTAEGKL